MMWIWLAIVILLVLAANGVLAYGGLGTRQTIGNAIKARYELKRLVAVQQEYHCYRAGRDEPRYAAEMERFYAVAAEEARTKSGRFAEPRPSFISRELADAVVPGKARNGYFFVFPGELGRALTGEGAGEGPVEWSSSFEMAVTPAIYGETGYLTFFVNAVGRVRRKDLKRQVSTWDDLEGERPMSRSGGWSNA